MMSVVMLGVLASLLHMSLNYSEPFQARIQAQQMADKENKLLQFLEERQVSKLQKLFSANKIS